MDFIKFLYKGVICQNLIFKIMRKLEIQFPPEICNVDLSSLDIVFEIWNNMNI